MKSYREHVSEAERNAIREVIEEVVIYFVAIAGLTCYF